MTVHDEASPFSSLAKFRVTKFQYFLGTISAVAVLTLGLMSTLQLNLVTNQVQNLSTMETPAESIIFTQRETLVYATRLAQWSNGAISRRTVQIARSLLEQRLSVIDTSGKSMAERAPKTYWAALRLVDVLVANSPVGVLPNNLQSSVNAAISPAIDQIFIESRKFFVLYQKSVDQSVVDTNRGFADQDRLNFILFFIFVIFGCFFLFLNIRSNVKNYRASKIILDLEKDISHQTMLELEKAQLKVIELQELDRAANVFISTINHELRTPLTSIIGSIDLIRIEKLAENDPRLSEYLEVLERNADLLLDLVESILSISQMDYRDGPLSKDKVHINKIIDDAIISMQPEIEKLDHKVNLSSDGEYFVQGNSNQVSQVVINLLGNAIKFSPKSSLIKILIDRIFNQSGEILVRIRFEDQGIGIQPEDIDHLFSRFFRGANAVSQQFTGTGIGLALVQEIVIRHEGQIHVSSILNEGTTFTVEFPVFLSTDYESRNSAVDVSDEEIYKYKEA